MEAEVSGFKFLQQALDCLVTVCAELRKTTSRGFLVDGGVRDVVEYAAS